MRQVLNFRPLDIVPHKKGFIYLKTETDRMGNAIATLHLFDQDILVSKAVKKSAYLMTKFGEAYEIIASKVGDYISCETSFFNNGDVAVLFDTGVLNVFSADGGLIYQTDLSYQGSPVCSPAADDKHIWCLVPEKNAVIHYSPREKSVLLRIGGGKSKAFDQPIHLTKTQDKLFVCNRGNRKIREISLADYSVKDYREFDEPLYKYLRIEQKEYAVLDSGVYLI